MKYGEKLAPTPLFVQNVLENVSNCKEDRFSAVTMQEHLHTKGAILQNMIYDEVE